jgi:hypothetical protein
MKNGELGQGENLVEAKMKKEMSSKQGSSSQSKQKNGSLPKYSYNVLMK